MLRFGLLSATLALNNGRTFRLMARQSCFRLVENTLATFCFTTLKHHGIQVFWWRVLFPRFTKEIKLFVLVLCQTFLITALHGFKGTGVSPSLMRLCQIGFPENAGIDGTEVVP